MKLLKTIQFKQLSLEEIEGLEVRTAARAIVFDQDGRIGLLFVSLHNYHKLPGGGIEIGEDATTALKRECLEEIGCQIEIAGEVGEILEYRSEFGIKQINYCYAAKVIGEKGKSAFTDKEMSHGFEIKWVESPDEAVALLEADKPDNVEGKYIQVRDLVFLREFKKSEKAKA